MKVFLLNPRVCEPAGRWRERVWVRTGSRWPHARVKLAGMKLSYRPFPFPLAYAAACLRAHGHTVDALDAVALDLPEAVWMPRLAGWKPGLVFFEPLRDCEALDGELAARIRRETGATVVWGGPHATAAAARLLEAFPAVDGILLGEYERGLAAVCGALEAGSGTWPANLLRRGAAAPQPSACAALNLDDLPAPAYDLFPGGGNPDPTSYWDGFCQLKPALQMTSSRGCRASCAFCQFRHLMNRGAAWRGFPVSRVVDEMARAVRDYRVREIYFDDDDFAADPERTLALCQAISRAALPVRWSCMAGCAGLARPVLEAMGRAGCIGVKFGVETPARGLRAGVGKPVDPDRVLEIVRVCRGLGIKTHATFMVGLPGETPETLEETLRFLDGLDADTIQVSVATAYEGTPMFDRLKEFPLPPGACAARSRLLRRWLAARAVSPREWPGRLRVLARSVVGAGVGTWGRQVLEAWLQEGAACDA